MAKYFDKETLAILNQASKEIVAIRNRVAKLTPVDILDTDAVSSLFVYEIVSQYDPNYNINFARNGEDAKSDGVLIENKTTRVQGPLTKTGKPRKNAGQDALFQFHAMGDLEHSRYIFVAKDKDNLSIVRLYDISSKENCALVLGHLMQEREKWLEKSRTNKSAMKRDIVMLPETFIQNKLNLPIRMHINGCQIHKD
jgi:hypothetical protein